MKVTCAGCGSEFEAVRASRRFCSARCQKAASRGADSYADKPEAYADKLSAEASPGVRVREGEAAPVVRVSEPAVTDNRSGSEIVAGIIAAAEGTDGPAVPAEPDAVAKLIESGAVTLGPPEPVPAQGKVPAGFGGENHRGHKLAPHRHMWEKEAAAKGTRAPLSVTCTGRWWCESCSAWFSAARCAKHEDRVPELVTA